MRLLSIFSKVFLLGLAVSLVCAVTLNGLLGGRTAGFIPFVTLFAVVVSCLAMSVTMFGKYPLWQVVIVLAIGIVMVCFQPARGAVQDTTICTLVLFATTSLPFLAIRVYGLAFVNMGLSRGEKEKASTRGNIRRATSPLLDRQASKVHWRLYDLLSSMAAVAVLLGSMRLLFSCVPARTIAQELVNSDFRALILFVGLASPLAIIEAMSTSVRASRAARFGLLVVLFVGIGVFRAPRTEWTIVAVLVGIPSLCFIILSHMLRDQGFRLDHSTIRPSRDQR